MRKTETSYYCDMCGQVLNRVAELSMYTQEVVFELSIERHTDTITLHDFCHDCSKAIITLVKSKEG